MFCLPQCRATSHICLSAVGVSAGLFGYYLFVFCYNNAQAGCWALVSAIMAAMLLALHLSHLLLNQQRQEMCWFMLRLRLWQPATLNLMNIIGMTGIIGSLVGAIINLIIGFIKDDVLMRLDGQLYPGSHYITTGWCILALLWSTQLMDISKAYRTNLEHPSEEEQKRLLLKNNNTHKITIIV